MEAAYDRHMEPPEVKKQAEVSRARRVVQHLCTECGKPFQGIKIRRYDSRACQVRAYRRRKWKDQTDRRQADVPEL